MIRLDLFTICAFALALALDAINRLGSRLGGWRSDGRAWRFAGWELGRLAHRIRRADLEENRTIH